MTFQSRNPATGNVLATYPEHDESEIQARLELSARTWRTWSVTSIEQRVEVLLKLAKLLDERAEQYGYLITTEMGKPITEAIAEVRKAATGARHFAERGPQYLEPTPIDGMNAQVVFQSLGPVFAVMPWNLPFWQVLRFAIPTVLAGNTVLVKHADSVQGCAQALEQLMIDAGAPRGLYLNLAIRRGAVASVVADPRVSCATVTGSTQAGRAVAAEAGAHGKKVVLELGGSDPFIVLDDADIERAAQIGVVSRFSNNAQSCIAAKRFLVSASIATDFVRHFVERTAALQIGDPLLSSTQLGPLARPDLRDQIHDQVQAAIQQGGRLLLGGNYFEGPGNFYAPTVITDLPHDAPIAKEEIFGPVAMIFTFKTDEEAIALANSTEYGLGASVWSRDINRAQKVASAIEAGAVFINDFVRSDPRAPFGGIKGSGFGRELGALGARELTNAKLVVVS